MFAGRSFPPCLLSPAGFGCQKLPPTALSCQGRAFKVKFLGEGASDYGVRGVNSFHYGLGFRVRCLVINGCLMRGHASECCRVRTVSALSK